MLSALPTSHPPIPMWGNQISGLNYGSLSLRPVDLLALLSELTRSSPSRRGLLLPGFRRIVHPLERQLASLQQASSFASHLGRSPPPLFPAGRSVRFNSEQNMCRYLR